jgi:acyl-CoA thioesterase FadM
MNLYLRLLITLFRTWRLPRIAPGDDLVREFRVLPNDVDVNGHMNNGRYHTMIDLMIVEYFVRCGLAGAAWRNGWRPMSGGAIASYRRGLKPFSRYTLRFRLDACDAQWNYMRFEFLHGQRICTTGYMKGAVVGKSGFVSNAESYAAVGRPVPDAPLPEAVVNWLKAESAVVSTAW